VSGVYVRFVEHDGDVWVELDPIVTLLGWYDFDAAVIECAVARTPDGEMAVRLACLLITLEVHDAPVAMIDKLRLLPTDGNTEWELS
jgi:hypothetical protein